MYHFGGFPTTSELATVSHSDSNIAVTNAAAASATATAAAGA